MSQAKKIVIEKAEIMPGESKIISINVGRLPSDTRINIVAHIIRGKEEGPTVLLLGGIHGDEVNGVEIVRRTIAENRLGTIVKGTIIAIPLLNVYGFINFSREVPDGKDVNRSFPGSTSGSLASRVARTLTKKILPFVDYAIDFHTGGASRYNYPQVRYTKGYAESKKLADVFKSPFLIENTVIAHSFRKACRDLEIPSIVFEGGESIRLDGYSIDVGIKGILRVLKHFKMIKEKIQEPDYKVITIKKTSWLRAPFSGMFIWSQSSGTFVKVGEPIGMIYDPFGTKSVTVTSKYEGYIIGHNNASVVNQGDALFHIGYEIKA